MNRSELLRAVAQCVRSRYETRGGLRILSQLGESDWKQFLAFVRHQRIAPYIYTCLKEKEILPSVRAQLQADHARNALRNLRIIASASEIFSSLANTGIAAMGLKGVHLARFVYPDIGMRSMADIDLLVRREDLDGAAQCLRTLGYAVPVRDEPWTHHHLPPFERPDAVPVEVHWTVPPSYPFTIDVEGIWTRAVRKQIGNTSLFVPTLEDLICILSVHTIVHHKMRSGIRPLVDVAEIVMQAGERMDWDAVGRIARSWKAATTIALMLHLTQKILDVPIATRVIRSLHPDPLGDEILTWGLEHIDCLEPQHDALSPTLAQLWGPMAILGKGRLLFSHILLSEHEIAAMYPGLSGPAKSIRGRVLYLKDCLLRSIPTLKKAFRNPRQLSREAAIFQRLVDRR